MINKESKIIPLLRQEEGVRYTPYLDSLGYPTTGVGFKLGPQGAPLSHYTFTLSDSVIDAWLENNIAHTLTAMMENSEIAIALKHCHQPRQDILISMAYQMGVTGLGNFHHMLSAMIQEDWNNAADQMLNSTWAKQTPGRAHRHAEVMQSGMWLPTYEI